MVVKYDARSRELRCSLPRAKLLNIVPSVGITLNVTPFTRHGDAMPSLSDWIAGGLMALCFVTAGLVVAGIIIIIIN